MLTEGIYEFLAADSGIQAQLGTRTDGSTGIWPVMAPDEPLVPWIVYQQISGSPLQISMQGTGRLQTARLRFTCYGSTYKQAKALANALKLAMISLFGVLPDPAKVVIGGSWLKLELDEAEPMLRGTIFASHCDFEILYTDTQ